MIDSFSMEETNEILLGFKGQCAMCMHVCIVQIHVYYMLYNPNWALISDLCVLYLSILTISKEGSRGALH